MHECFERTLMPCAGIRPVVMQYASDFSRGCLLDVSDLYTKTSGYKSDFGVMRFMHDMHLSGIGGLT